MGRTVIAFGTVYGATLFAEGGPLPTFVIIGSMIGGMIGWWRTTARRPVDPARAVPLVLLLLALFYVHIGEETLTGFNQAIAILTGKRWNDHDFILLIGLIGPISGLSPPGASGKARPSAILCSGSSSSA